MTPSELADLAERLVGPASRLVGAVHDDGPADVARVLAEVPSHHLPALTVVLAAMVNPDRSAADLLAWVTWDDTPPPLQTSLFSGWHHNVPPDPPPTDRPGTFPSVDVAGLNLDQVEAWPDEVCRQLRNESRRMHVDPSRAPYLTAARLEYDRRRHRRTRAAERAKAASQSGQIAVS